MIDFGRIKLRGTLAWWIWGIAHIYFLIGLRNRLSVALSWLWIHARDQRTARLITQGSSKGDAVASIRSGGAFRAGPSPGFALQGFGRVLYCPIGTLRRQCRT